MQTPVYITIAEDLAKRIRSGEFTPGQRLMTVNEFCAHYNVSLATAHRSISTLVNQGLVRTVPRKGIYAAGVPAPTPPQTAERVKRILLVESTSHRDPRPGVARSFTHGIVDSVLEASRHHQIPIQFQYVSPGPTSSPRIYFAPQSGDAIIAVGGGVSVALMSHLDLPNVPSVLIDAAMPNANCVVTDNYEGMYQVVRHLHRHGHRRVALAVCFATRGANVTNENERRDAFLHHARIAGMEVTNIESGDWEDLFALLHIADPATAIAFTRDVAAVHFIALARERGINVPAQVSVTGFDDWAVDPATLLELTTARVDFAAMGQAAVELILNPPKHRSRFNVWCRIKPQLVVRSSVVPPRPLKDSLS